MTCPTCGDKAMVPGHIGPPSSRGAARLDRDVIGVLKAELAKPGMTARELVKRTFPPVSTSVFSRAMRGHKVSVPALTACVELASAIVTMTED